MADSYYDPTQSAFYKHMTKLQSRLDMVFTPYIENQNWTVNHTANKPRRLFLDVSKKSQLSDEMYNITGGRLDSTDCNECEAYFHGLPLSITTSLESIGSLRGATYVLDANHRHFSLRVRAPYAEDTIHMAYIQAILYCMMMFEKYQVRYR
jgi:hypothetical protein